MYNCYFHLTSIHIFTPHSNWQHLPIYDQLSAFNPSRLLILFFPSLRVHPFLDSNVVMSLFYSFSLLVCREVHSTYLSFQKSTFQQLTSTLSSFNLTLHRPNSSTWHLFLCSSNLYMFLDVLQISTTFPFLFCATPWYNSSNLLCKQHKFTHLTVFCSVIVLFYI